MKRWITIVLGFIMLYLIVATVWLVFREPFTAINAFILLVITALLQHISEQVLNGKNN